MRATNRSISFVLWCAFAAATIAASSAQAQCSGFSISTSTGATIVPGTLDIGNHCDDCTTPVALPFPVTFYGASYSTVNVSSNGNLQFTTSDGNYSNACLPQAGTLGVSICAHWDDLLTDGANDGIFTSVSGSAPNRVFNVEWRARYYSGGGDVDFEVRLFEDGSHFDVIFGTISQGGAGATVGVQHTVLPPTQFSCNNAGLINAGTRVTFACYNGPTGSATASPNPVYLCPNDSSSLLSIQVTPGTSPPSSGLSARANLTSIGGPSDQVFYNDGTHGDAVPNDNIWSFLHVLPNSVPTGSRNLFYSIGDAQGRSTTGVLNLVVNPCPSTGPDIIVRNLTDVNYYGSIGNISAFAIGTDACNIGDYPAIWIQGGTQHPLIAQNLYRLKSGRFEQLGQSFLKHSFQSLNSPGCGVCVQPPMGGAQLGVGCSDVYGAGYNGSQGNLGPRSTCNPTTGVFSWPPPPAPPASDVIGQRLQVFSNDVNPLLNAGALYFGEAQYVSADDAQWSHISGPATNGLNNASYQRFEFSIASLTPTIVGPAQQMVPAIHAWKEADPGVTLVSADYIDSTLGGAGIVARFWVGARATDNGNGTWHYEYAVHNLNADRAGGSFAVPIAPGAVITNVGFHGIFAHSGEPYPNTATNPDNWVSTVSNGEVRWSCPEVYQPPNGNNANALRWGTLYNFRFDSNIPPRTANATLGLFKPGSPSSIPVVAIPTPTTGCDSIDFNNDTSLFDPQDIDAYLSVYSEGPCIPSGATCNDIDFNNDGSLFDPCDIDAFLLSFSEGPCTLCGA